MPEAMTEAIGSGTQSFASSARIAVTLRRMVWLCGSGVMLVAFALVDLYPWRFWPTDIFPYYCHLMLMFLVCAAIAAAEGIAYLALGAEHAATGNARSSRRPVSRRPEGIAIFVMAGGL